MFLIKAKSNINSNETLDDSCYIQQLRRIENLLPTEHIKTGGYYIYKEKFGIVALVKVLEDMSEEDWAGYRVIIKRVLYSPWQIPKNTVLEIGFSKETKAYPPSWHFEPGMMLVKCDRRVTCNDNANTEIESAL